MAYPTIMPVWDLAQFIQDTITNVNNGLYNTQLVTGITPLMPDEIKFDMILLKAPQAIPITVTTNDAPPAGQSSQTTTHGETVDTTDQDETGLVGYDPTAALASGYANSPGLEPFSL